MDKIVHKQLTVNGISMHVAELGEGPAVLLLHGFPELWYSWRHQMVSLSARGYRTIAPDLRGYGDTEAPASVTSYTGLHIVGDMVALLDALGLEQVFLVAHDWGAIVAWWFCLMRPDRIKALVNTSVIFLARNPVITILEGFRASMGDGFYMCRFQEAGEAEAAFARTDTATVLATFFSSRDPNPPRIPVELPLDVLFKTPPTLPEWLTQQDIDYYASKFSKTGFTGGFNYYRNLDLSWELTAPWTGAQVRVPAKFIIGDIDLTYNIPGVKEFIHGGDFKKYVPLLEPVVVLEGVGHYLNQEKPFHKCSELRMSHFVLHGLLVYLHRAAAFASFCHAFVVETVEGR